MCYMLVRRRKLHALIDKKLSVKITVMMTDEKTGAGKIRAADKASVGNNMRDTPPLIRQWLRRPSRRRKDSGTATATGTVARTFDRD